MGIHDLPTPRPPHARGGAAPPLEGRSDSPGPTDVDGSLNQASEGAARAAQPQAPAAGGATRGWKGRLPTTAEEREAWERLQTYTTDEASILLGITIALVQRLVRLGELRAYVETWVVRRGPNGQHLRHYRYRIIGESLWEYIRARERSLTERGRRIYTFRSRRPAAGNMSARRGDVESGRSESLDTGPAE